MLLGVAGMGLGVWLLYIKLFAVLFYAPAWIYANIFVGGPSNPQADASFYRALCEGVVVFVFAIYGALLFVCGAMNWGVAKASARFGIVVAVLGAVLAVTVWKTFTDQVA